MQNVELKKLNKFYRPWYIFAGPKDGAELKQIKIFNNEEIFTLNRGWLEDHNDGGRDIEGLFFEELKKKKKIDLGLKKSFLALADNWDNRKVLTLFLYCQNLKTEIFKKYGDKESDTFYKKLIFSVNGREICEEIYHEEIKTDFGRQVEEMKKEIKELAKVDISEYELAEIMKKFSIKKI